MTWASTWEMMNRTLEVFATRNTDSSDAGIVNPGRPSRSLKNSKTTRMAALTHGWKSSLKCVVAKKEEELETAEKIFEILLNRFGSGMKGHQAMMRFEKRSQRDDESVDKFLDDLEILRRRIDPEESTHRRIFSIASKFIDRVKSDDLRTMLATYYTLSKIMHQPRKR